MKIQRWLSILIALSFVALFVPRLTADPADQVEEIRTYSRDLEFNYYAWMGQAMWDKFLQSSLGYDRYLPAEEGSQLLTEYLEVVRELSRLENDLKDILSDPGLENPEEAAAEIRTQLEETRQRHQQLGPVVEEVLQRQMTASLSELDLTLGGQAVPPILYQSLHKSYALVVSPRDEIRTLLNVMLVPDLTLEEITALENALEENLDVSALVVGIGGVGTYPAMIVETSNLPWLVHVVAHEWTHNYLTLRPLGMHYYASPTLQVINETVADLVSTEVKDAVLKAFYPEHAPQPPQPVEEQELTEEEKLRQALREYQDYYRDTFDFRHEMHKTRVVVDRLLREDKVEEAERYMEERRIFFWENGYRLRKINQAYFAFHGSYAASPGGAVSGATNTLGNNLRNLRQRMPSLAAYVRKVAWMWRVEQFHRTFDLYLGGEG
jgi:hypothetical protein